MRLGGTDTVKVDTRIIAATNANLKSMVERGTFREDLFYRLNVINLEVPPLRARREDIPLLVEFFARQFCEENEKALHSFSPEALKLLVDYPWPGNVRELENTVERAVVLAYSEEMGSDLLPDSISNPPLKSALAISLKIDPDRRLSEIVDAFERQVILERLEQTGWSQTEAAESFSVPLSTLNQKIKRHGIDSRKKRERFPA